MKNFRLLVVLLLSAAVPAISASKVGSLLPNHNPHVLTPSDGAPNDGFGISVATSGNTVVVGSYRHNSTGAVYVFVKPASGWQNMTQTAELTLSTSAIYFGFAVAVSGDGKTIVAAAEGAAYVFVEPAGGWTNMTETAELNTPNAPAPAGNTVGISGNTVVVGAENGNAAYIFVKPSTGWAGTLAANAELTPSDGVFNDYFGFSAFIQGNTVVVGSIYATFNGGPGPGAAYVFVEPAGGWRNMTQTAKLTASDGLPFAYLGCAVALSGNTVVVGASLADQDSGAAYVFVEPATGWVDMTQNAKLTITPGSGGSLFGVSAWIQGNKVFAGTGYGTGYLFGFLEPAGGWQDMTQTAQVNPPQGSSEFGVAVSASEHTMVVGAPGVYGQNLVGAAYIFTLVQAP